MTVKSRVPDDIQDQDAIRNFLDSLDRKAIKVGNLTDLAASPTTTELATAFNALLAIFRER